MQSRRQDQTGIQDVWKYLTHYRELAHPRRATGGSPRSPSRSSTGSRRTPQSFATTGYSVGEFLAEALAYPDITAVLPRPATPGHHVHAVRSGGRSWCGIRRDDTTAPASSAAPTGTTGGRTPPATPPRIREIASGLSTNPTFFKLRKGAAILDSVRMSPRFFSTGHFRSDGVTSVAAVAGGCSDRGARSRTTCRCRSATAGADGDYALGSEGRFYSKMDFPHRPEGVPGAGHDDHDHGRSATARSTWTSTSTDRPRR